MRSIKKLGTSRILPLQPEERLTKLKEIFNKEYDPHRAKAKAFVSRQFRNMVPYHDDILVTAELRAWTYWVKNDGRVDHFWSFIGRIIINVGLDFLKKDKHHLQAISFYHMNEEGDELDFDVFDVADPERLIDDPYSLKMLHEAIEALPTNLKKVVCLYAEQASYAEIADYMNVPIGTIKSRLNRGRTFLANELRRRGYFEEYPELAIESYCSNEQQEEKMKQNVYIGQPQCPFINLDQMAEYYIRATQILGGTIIAQNTAQTTLSRVFSAKYHQLTPKISARIHLANTLRLKELGRETEIPKWNKIFDDLSNAVKPEAKVRPNPATSQNGKGGKKAVKRRPKAAKSSNPTPPFSSSEITPQIIHEIEQISSDDNSLVLRALENISGVSLAEALKGLRTHCPFVSDRTLESLINDLINEVVEKRIRERQSNISKPVSTP